MDGAQTDREAALYASESCGARISAGAGALVVEQLSELCFRRRGRGANQSVGRSQDKNSDAGCMSSHLYKERKGGPATQRFKSSERPVAGVRIFTASIAIPGQSLTRAFRVRKMKRPESLASSDDRLDHLALLHRREAWWWRRHGRGL